MVIVRLIRAFGIIVLSFFSALIVLIFSWMPKGGIYPFVSHRIFGPGMIAITGSSVQTKGLDKLKDYSGNAIFVANHQSHFDIPAIMTAINIPFYFVAKKELRRIPIFGWGMWATGMVFVDRSSREKSLASLKKAAKTIRKGKAVLSFPEGTRSKSGKIQKFKKGAFHMAKEGSLEIIPISVSGTRDILAPGGKLSVGTAVVTVCEPIPLQTVTELSIQELAELAQKRIAAVEAKN